jgi:hypothetical protein
VIDATGAPAPGKVAVQNTRVESSKTRENTYGLGEPWEKALDEPGPPAFMAGKTLKKLKAAVEGGRWRLT